VDESNGDEEEANESTVTSKKRWAFSNDNDNDNGDDDDDEEEVSYEGGTRPTSPL
jgi:hypothetical protein